MKTTFVLLFQIWMHFVKLTCLSIIFFYSYSFRVCDVQFEKKTPSYHWVHFYICENFIFFNLKLPRWPQEQYYITSHPALRKSAILHMATKYPTCGLPVVAVPQYTFRSRSFNTTLILSSPNVSYNGSQHCQTLNTNRLTLFNWTPRTYHQ